VVLLLIVGFVAGTLTDDVDPGLIFGHAFPPLVSAAVAVILYDACLSVNLRFLTSHTRQIVSRLIVVGVVATIALGAVAAGLMLGMSRGGAVLAGAILAATGPSVVGPILGRVQPAERLRHVLYWESALLDPICGIIAVIAFYGLVAGSRAGTGAQAGQFALSIVIGVAGGVIGTAALWLALRKGRLPRTLMPPVQVAVVVAVATGCDALHDDSGLLAAIIMGLALANLPNFRVPARRLLETLVQPVLGIVLLTVAATITPHELSLVWLPALGVTGALVLVVRPLVALVATRKTDLTRRECLFAGWMAPRGVVAAAIAAAVTGPLAARGIPEATKILPLTFLVVVVTVLLYGLTAGPASHWLGVLRSPRSRPLLVGGEEWVIDLGLQLQTLGLDVLMWAGLEHEREQIRQAALHLAPGRLLTSVIAERAELSGVTTVLLLTPEDDFNALAAVVLRYSVGDQVYRVGPPAGDRGVVAPYSGGRVLFGHALNRSTLASRYAEGARIVVRPARGDLPSGHEVLFVVHADGRLEPATRQRVPELVEGDTVVLLSTTAS
ncbi:MAG TPA: cation:proton antiporter, partial [Streptosporangiaceae bacterium]|nr:cation:proton antiporter [Streptosporangiaceae bacterium]